MQSYSGSRTQYRIYDVPGSFRSNEMSGAHVVDSHVAPGPGAIADLSILLQPNPRMNLPDCCRRQYCTVTRSTAFCNRRPRQVDNKNSRL